MLNSSNIVGRSVHARRLRDAVREQAERPAAAVLISGPAGSGKRWLARAIHELGGRADQPFVPVSCASLPGRLFASQLLGHLPGGFLPGLGSSLGVLRSAEGGTVFLEHVEELDADSQAILLQVLQSGCVVPMGGMEGIPVNVRIVASCRYSLHDEVADGYFDAELCELLSQSMIETTALADHAEDVADLAEHFLNEAAAIRKQSPKTLDVAALAWLAAYAWPGNSAELRELMHKAAALDSATITCDVLHLAGFAAQPRVAAWCPKSKGAVPIGAERVDFASTCRKRFRRSSTCHKSNRGCGR